jgi:hypothetical protein
MAIGQLVAMVVMGTAFLANGYAGRDRFWFILGSAILGFTAFMLGRDGLRWILFAGPITGSFALLALLLGSLFWAELVGLPRPIAYLSGIGLKNRPLTFNNRLYTTRLAFVEAIRVAQEELVRRSEALATAEAQVKRERTLKPPDRTWGQLRDDIADDDEAWIELIRSDAPTERRADHVEAFGPVLARWRQMQEAATAEQRLISDPGLQRRGMVISLVGIGASLLLAGLAVAGAYHLREVGLARTEIWVAIGMLAGGSLLLGRALMLAVKRDGRTPNDPGSTA